jgi:hypothetical protein
MRGFVFRLQLWIAAIALCGLINCASYAQSTGHYLGGATGLENGSQAPPGFFGTYLGYLNPVDSLKG